MAPKPRRALIRWLGRTHRLVYRLSRGRVLGTVAGMPVLLLTTTGRRTGKARTTPLTFFRDGAQLVVVGSNGGEDRPPAWSLNLGEHAAALVELRDDRFAVVARIASPAERARLWPVITATYPGYDTYERRTTRPIPVFLLTPTAPEGSESAPGTQ